MSMWENSLKLFPEKRLHPFHRVPEPFQEARFGGSGEWVVEEQDFMTARQMRYSLIQNQMSY